MHGACPRPTIIVIQRLLSDAESLAGGASMVGRPPTAVYHPFATPHSFSFKIKAGVTSLFFRMGLLKKITRFVELCWMGFFGD